MNRRILLLATITAMILWLFSSAIFFEELVLSTNTLLRSPEGFALILISNNILFYSFLTLLKKGD